MVTVSLTRSGPIELRRFCVIQVTRLKNLSGCALDDPAITDTATSLVVNLGGPWRSLDTYSGFSLTYSAIFCVGFFTLPAGFVVRLLFM